MLFAGALEQGPGPMGTAWYWADGSIAFPGFRGTPTPSWASRVAQMVKNLPAMQETRVPPLGGEDPSEEEMAIHSSVLAWEIPWTEESGGLQSMGLQRVGCD